jgi:hypothetical protein
VLSSSLHRPLPGLNARTSLLVALGTAAATGKLPTRPASREACVSICPSRPRTGFRAPHESASEQRRETARAQ